MPGQRQGNPQLGFEIRPHTCGCIITQSAVNRSWRKPRWMKRVPLALKDGHHLVHHIKTEEVHPNCSAFYSRFQSQPQNLTHEEWTAWTPHLGHYTPFVIHIPPQYCHLIPANPLEENYVGVLPNHPLPNPLPTVAPSLPQGFASMSIQRTSMVSAFTSQHSSAQSASAGLSNPFLPSNRSMTAGLSNQSNRSNDLGVKPVFVFVETPWLTRMHVDLEAAKRLLVYGRCLVPKAKHDTFLKALRLAPFGMAFHEPPEKDDQHQDIISFYIHDLASIHPWVYFVQINYDSTRWHGLLPS